MSRWYVLRSRLKKPFAFFLNHVVRIRTSLFIFILVSALTFGCGVRLNRNLDDFLLDEHSSSIPHKRITGIVDTQFSTRAPVVLDGDSEYASLSPDGTQVLFQSKASNLIRGVNPDQRNQIYLKNLITGSLQLISAGPDGKEGDGDSYEASFSPDGTQVLFLSKAQNLTGNKDLNPKEDIFIKDLVGGDIYLFSTDSTGSAVDANFDHPRFSPDGTHILFDSNSTELAPGITSGIRHIYLKDLSPAGTVSILTLNEKDEEADGDSQNASFNSDGTKIIFESLAGNLTELNDPGKQRIFIKNINTKIITPISTSEDGKENDVGGSESNPRFSPVNDNIVLFESDADNFIVGTTPGLRHVYLKDITELGKQTIILISSDFKGQEANGNSMNASFSPDGTEVVFQSESTNLASGGTSPGTSHIYVKDFSTQDIELVSSNENSEDGDLDSQLASFGPTQERIIFESLSTNISSDSSPGVFNVFIKDRNTEKIQTLSKNEINFVPGGMAGHVFSPDGKWVAFNSSDNEELVPGDTNGKSDIFVQNLETLEVKIASSKNDNSLSTAGGISQNYTFSPDGKMLVFDSFSNDLDPNCPSPRAHIYIKNLENDSLKCISRSSSGDEGDGWSLFPSFSPDGKWVTFQSMATNLIPEGTTNTTRKIYIKNLETEEIRLLTKGFDGIDINGDCSSIPFFSPNQPMVYFGCNASNLTKTDTAGNIFSVDISTLELKVVSTKEDGNLSNGTTGGINGVSTISPDGNWIAFSSDATDLVSDDTNSKEDVFIKNLKTGQIKRVSTATDGSEGNGISYSPTFSPNGQFLSFVSRATNFTTPNTTGYENLFIKDLITGETTLISISQSGVETSGTSLIRKGFFTPDGKSIYYIATSDNPYFLDDFGITPINQFYEYITTLQFE